MSSDHLEAAYWWAVGWGHLEKWVAVVVVMACSPVAKLVMSEQGEVE